MSASNSYFSNISINEDPKEPSTYNHLLYLNLHLLKSNGDNLALTWNCNQCSYLLFSKLLLFLSGFFFSTNS